MRLYTLLVPCVSIACAIAALHSGLGHTKSPRRQPIEVPTERKWTVQTLLDDRGQMAAHVAYGDYAGWKEQAHRLSSSDARFAPLHVSLGEYEMAQNENPSLGLWHFAVAKRTAQTRDTLALAEWDTGMTCVRRGAFRKA